MDFPGLWQHFTIPAEALTESTSSRTASASMAPASAAGRRSTNRTCSSFRCPTRPYIDPFCKDTTLTLICNIQDPLTKEDYSRDPRNVARKAVNYMKEIGVADVALFGPEVEFFVFDDVRYDQDARSGYYFVDSMRRRLEHRPRRAPQSRPQAALQGRLLPLPSLGRHARSAFRNDADDDPVRPERRSPSPRSGVRRPRGSRHPRRRPAAHGGQRARSTSTSSRTSPAGTARPPPSCPSRSFRTTAAA